MSAEHSSKHPVASPVKRHKVEGPLNHYLAYIISIILTMLAFAVVIYGGLDRSFLLMFLVTLAIVQAFFQIYVWMHGKERGHTVPLFFLFSGMFVAIMLVLSAVYWMWW